MRLFLSKTDRQNLEVIDKIGNNKYAKAYRSCSGEICICKDEEDSEAPEPTPEPPKIEYGDWKARMLCNECGADITEQYLPMCCGKCGNSRLEDEDKEIGHLAVMREKFEILVMVGRFAHFGIEERKSVGWEKKPQKEDSDPIDYKKRVDELIKAGEGVVGAGNLRGHGIQPSENYCRTMLTNWDEAKK